MIRWFAFALFGFTCGAHSAALSLCPQNVDVGQFLIKKDYYQANGKVMTLVASEREVAGCKSLSITLDLDNIAWMEVVSRRLAERLRRGVVIQLGNLSERVRISEISPLFDEVVEKPTAILPIDINLLNVIGRIRTFGVEERADVELHDGTLRVTCRAGSRPAGAVVELQRSEVPSTMPLLWRLVYRASSIFQLGFASYYQYEKELPFWQRELSVASVKTSVDIEVQTSIFQKNRQAVLSIICPAQAGYIDLESFALVPPAQASRVPPRSIWVWEPRQWVTSRGVLLSLAKQYGARRVFISVVVDEEGGNLHYLAELRQFLADAHDQGIGVWIVEGDPYVVMPGEREKIVQRARIISFVSNSADEKYRPDGMQYDIEPYLIPGYRQDEPHWLMAYIETIKRIKSATTLPMEIVVPYWWQFSEIDGGNAIRKVLEIGDGINVMLYRTHQEDIQRLAQPILDLGVELGKPVSIALENGPIDSENLQIYVPAERGNLWMTPLDDIVVLLGLENEENDGYGRTFALRQSRVVDGSRVTFRAKPEHLTQIIPKLERVWSHWRSFNGVSIHGVE